MSRVLPYGIRDLPFQQAHDGRRMLTGLQIVGDPGVARAVKKYAEHFEYLVNMDAVVVKCDPAKSVTNG